MQNDKVWTKNFLLIIIINFLVFMNHIMILSTFPMFLEQVLGLNAAMAGLAAFGFSAVAVVLRPVIGWMLDCGGASTAHPSPTESAAIHKRLAAISAPSSSAHNDV